MPQARPLKWQLKIVRPPPRQPNPPPLRMPPPYPINNEASLSVVFSAGHSSDLIRDDGAVRVEFDMMYTAEEYEEVKNM